jgi:hypothetical protein
VALQDFANENHWFHTACAAAGAVIVIGWGKLSEKFKNKEEPETPTT